MKAYYFGNRRRLRCLYGAPGFPYEYIPEVVSRGNKVSTPGWSFSPRNGEYGDIRNEYKGFGVTANTVAGVAELTSGLITVGLRNQPWHSLFSKATIEIASGRHMPAALAEIDLHQSPDREFLDFPNRGVQGATSVAWGPHHDVISPQSAGGVICFLEKTPLGYGNRFVRLMLRKLEPKDYSTDFPLEGAASTAHLTVSLFTISIVNGNSETIVHSALVPLFQWEQLSGFSPLVRLNARVSLAFDNNGHSYLFASVVSDSAVLDVPRYMGGFGYYVPPRSTARYVHTAAVQYSPPSEDATIFGVVTKPSPLSGPYVNNGGIANSYRSVISALYEGSVGSAGLRIVETKHDTLVDVAFTAGATGRPDIDNSFAVSRLRDEIEVSEIPERVVTANVRCGSDTDMPAPETEGESSQRGPVVDFASVREPFLAEMYAGSRQVIKAKALAASAHVVDKSCLTRHSSVLHSLPQGSSIHIGGKRFSSAKVTVVARGTGSFDGELFSEPIDIPEGEDIDIGAFYDLTKWSFQTRPTPGMSYCAMPLGEFDCVPFSIGGAQSAAGLMRCAIEQIDADITIDENNTFHIKSHAELVAVFSVVMQESGTFSVRDFYVRNNSAIEGVTDLQWAKAVLPSPSSPTGQLADVAVYVPPASPSPVLSVQLFARTCTAVDKPGSANGFYAPWSGRNDSPPMVALGRFVFNKAQTASLLNGDEVLATNWQTAYGEVPEQGDPGGYIRQYDGRPFSAWPVPWPVPFVSQLPAISNTSWFWLNFKVRLNIEG